MEASLDKPVIRSTLEHALAFVAAGEAEPAMPLAIEVLDHALETGDFGLQGEAMHCLAVCELRLLGRFDRALELSERAALCQQRSGHNALESAALATHAVAAVRLGRHERAMESSLLAVRLAESVGQPWPQVVAYHALGVAAYSGRSFAESRNAYQRAIQLAADCEPPRNVFELHVDLAFTEGLHYFTERNLDGGRLSLDAMTRHIAECHRLRAEDGGNISLSPGSHVNNLLVMWLTTTLLETWRGNLPDARRSLEAFRAFEGEHSRPWMRAAAHWGEAEIALAEGDLLQAKEGAQALIEIAVAHGHETLTGFGYQLASYVCQRQGDFVNALDALQHLLRHEQSARAESLKSRVGVIEWQLELRQNEQRVRRLETDSRLFEKLAMEDALTGLPNRRRLAGELATWLETQDELAGPLCVALIDVDNFKQVNDRHSHHVGDAVLKGIAHAFRRNLREQDFPARLAGDEFVIVFRQTTLADAGAICDQLGHAIRAADWSVIAPDLDVSVSIGLSEASAGESVDALLSRSDGAMYARKADRR